MPQCQQPALTILWNKIGWNKNDLGGKVSKN